MGMERKDSNRQDWTDYVANLVEPGQYYILVYSEVTKLSDVISIFCRQDKSPCKDEQQAVSYYNWFMTTANNPNIINMAHLSLGHTVQTALYRRWTEEEAEANKDTFLDAEANRDVDKMLSFLDEMEKNDDR